MVRESVTTKIDSIAMEMRAKGEKLIALNAGQPDFPLSDEISEALKNAIDENRNRYVQVAGIPQLREAISRKLKTENNLDYSADEIVVSAGAKQALYNTITALCHDSDEVIIPMPAWVSYSSMVELAGARAVPVMPGKDFSLDLAAIEKAVSSKTRAIIINSPNNPTGAVYSEESLRKLAEIAENNNFYIISDEVYEKILYADTRHFSIGSISPEVRKLTVTINSFSKTYSMTGLRLGYCACDRSLAKEITAVQSSVTGNASSIVQYAGLAALKQKNEAVLSMVNEYEKRKNILLSKILSIKGVECFNPQGAFYLFPNVSKLYTKEVENSEQFCSHILSEYGILAVPGSAFGMEDYVRLSFASASDVASFSELF